MSSEQNKVNGQRIFEEIWNAGNLALAEELFAPHYVLHVPLGTFQGVEWLKQYVTAMRSAFPDIHVTIEDQFADQEQRVPEAYPGATYARLAALKKPYDPTNLLHLNQNVKPSLH